jgi:hypothetical protein
MTAKDREREVARALKQQREADEASAPSFHATLRSARAGRASRRRAIGPAVAAAALLVFIAGLLLLVPKHPLPLASRRLSPAPSSAEASLESWESPTDFLLDTPGSEIWHGLPRLLEPLPPNLPKDSPFSKKGAPS